MNIDSDIITAYHAEVLETPDGFSLRTAVFRTDTVPCKGSVLLLHGRNECIEKYDHVIVDILARGLDVVTFDWRGQGASDRFFADGRRGYVDHFEQYATDFELVYKHIALPEARAPFYVLGHSTGALVALYFAPRMLNRVRRMVLTAPFLALQTSRFKAAQLHNLASIMCFMGLGSAYIHGSRSGNAKMAFKDNPLTSDRQRFERNRALMDPANGLGLGGPGAAWFHACTNAMDVVYDPEHLAKVHIPTLMIGSGEDKIVSSRSIEDFATRLRSGSLVMIDGARHEIMQEADHYRSQFFAAFDAFVPGSD